MITANYFPNKIKANHGTLIFGDTGLEFIPDFSRKRIQLTYDNMKGIRVITIFKHWFRGFYVIDQDDALYRFVTRDTKKVIHILNQKIDKRTIRVFRGTFTKRG
ncbi:MAG: DUF956 family protein [Lactobacillus sp.]|nr:DUF956 family protein [Lactobacillus sp.]